jgi:retron-type reverse transcriptase
MTDYEKVCDFANLYCAHQAARRGKQGSTEVIRFELDLAKNLTELSDALKDGSYRLAPYVRFQVHEPKLRDVHALSYRDRVVQHCICDQVLAPVLDKKLIYDNAACRKGKGTHFSIHRLSEFMRRHYRCHGAEGWLLKADVRKYFASIKHSVLKAKLAKVFGYGRFLSLLYRIIDSYEFRLGCGLPLGNQTSQWFAIYYLDGMDRLIKEQMGIRGYVRYMDDFVLVHRDKRVLEHCWYLIALHLKGIGLELNEKTQIMPLYCGVEYLGWRFRLTKTGKVIRRLKPQSKRRIMRTMHKLSVQVASGKMSKVRASQAVASYQGHLRHGHTGQLQAIVLSLLLDSDCQ